MLPWTLQPVADQVTAGRERALAGVGGHPALRVEDGDLPVGVLGGVRRPADEVGRGRRRRPAR